MRVKRWLLGGLLVFLTSLVVIVSVVLSGLISGQHLKPLIINAARDHAGYDVSIHGDIAYQFWPAPHIQVGHIEASPIIKDKVSKRDDSNDAFMMRVDQLDLYMSILDLLKGRFTVDSLKLSRPSVLLGDVNGWKSDVLQSKGKIKPPPNSEQTTPMFQMKNFEVERGEIKFLTSGRSVNLGDVSFKLAKATIGAEYNVLLNASYDNKIFKSKFQLDAQDIKSGLLGVEGQFEAADYGLKSSVAGLVSWRDGLSYQGEIEAASNVNIPELGERAVNLNGLIKITAGDDGYNYELSNAHIDIGKLEYDVSSSGRFAGQEHKIDAAIDLNSKTKADTVLEAGVERLLGGLKARSKLKWTQKGNISIQGSLDALDNNVNYTLRNIFSDMPDIEISSKRLDLKRFYKRHKAVESSAPSLYSIFITQGQDAANAYLLEQLQIIPHLPSLSWDVSVNELVLDNIVLKNVKTKFETKERSINVTSYQSSLMDEHKISFTARADAGGDPMSYEGDINLEYRKPEKLLPFLVPQVAKLALTVSGQGHIYDWSGKAQLKKSSINFKALHKAEMPKGYVSMFLFDMDAGNFASIFDDPKLREVLHDAGLDKKANMASQIGVKLGKVIDVKMLEGKIGAMPFSITGSVNLGKDKPDMDLKLSAENLVYSNGAKTSGKKKVEWSRKEIKFPLLDSADAQIAFDLKNSRYQNIKIDSLKGDLAVKDGNIKINVQDGKSYDGDLIASISYEGEKNAHKNLNYEFDYQDFDVGGVLTALNKGKSGKTPLLEGQIDVKLSGRSRGRTMSALVYDLNGNGNISGDETSLNGIDVNSLAEMLRLDTKLEKNIKALDKTMNSALNKGVTKFENIYIPYKIEGGVVNISKGLLQSADFDLSISGDINLTQQSLDLKNTITFKGEGTESLPKVSFTIKGPINAPAKALASQVIEDFLRQKIERKINKAFNNVLDDLLDIPQKQSAPERAPSQTPPVTAPSAPAADENQVEQGQGGAWGNPDEPNAVQNAPNGTTDNENTNPQPSDTPAEIDPAQLFLKQILGGGQ